MAYFTGYLNLETCENGPTLTVSQDANLYENAQCLLVYAGQIDGFLDESLSYQRFSSKDEIASFFAKNGMNYFGSLNGDFVFLFFDKVNKKFYGGRSCTAYRQLYVKEKNGIFYFSSECHLLMEKGEHVNSEAVHHFLDWQCIPAPLTLWEKITKLTAGEVVVVEQGKYQKRCFEPPKYSRFTGSYDEAAQKVRRLFHEIMSDFLERTPGEIGVLMSSGIDSSVIASFLAKYGHSQSWQAWHLSFENLMFSEKEEATKAADYLSKSLHVVVMPTDAIALDCGGEPSADASALALNYLVDTINKQTSIQTLLLGDGADELFGGYYRSRWLPVCKFFDTIPFKWLRWIWEKIPYWPKIRNERTKFGKLMRLARSLKRTSYYRMLFCRFPFEERKLGYVASFNEMITSSVAERFSPCNWSFRSLLEYDYNFYLLNHLALKHNSVLRDKPLETFCPFMDLRMLVFLKSLPTNYLKKHGRKGLLIDAFKDILPPNVIRQTKKGFAVPLSEILSSESWRQRCLDAIDNRILHSFFEKEILLKIWEEHCAGKRDHSVFLYSLIVLCQQLHFADNPNSVLHNENLMLN